MYGDGLCLEYSYKRQSGIYRGASGNQRFNHTGCICAYCEVPVRSIQCDSSIQYIDYQRYLVCCHSADWRNTNSCYFDKKEGSGIL